MDSNEVCAVEQPREQSAQLGLEINSFTRRLLSNGSVAMNAPDLAAAADFFHITLTPWKFVGLAGSLIFGLRFVIQWIASEWGQRRM